VTLVLGKDVKDGEPRDDWFPVQKRPGKKKDKVCGDIRLVIHYTSREVRNIERFICVGVHPY